MTKEEARQRALCLAKTMQCNCDLDNWEPEPGTGHSWVCRIHKAAINKHWPIDIEPPRSTDE